MAQSNGRQTRGAVIVDSAPLAPVAHYPSDSCVAAGGRVVARAIAPHGFDLWAVEAVLGAGTQLSWRRDHADEAVFVRAGAIQVDGRRVGPDDVIIVEAGEAATITVTDQSRIIHFGSKLTAERPPGPLGLPAVEGRGVHVVERADCPKLSTTGTEYYADSDCPTCRVTLLRNRRTSAHRSPSHAHSADELIFMLDGDMRVGRTTLTPGVAIAVAGHHRYGLQSPNGFDFLNFRADASLYVGEPGSAPQLETIAAMRVAGL